MTNEGSFFYQPASLSSAVFAFGMLPTESAAVSAHVGKKREQSSLPLDLLSEDASSLPQLLNCIFITDE